MGAVTYPEYPDEGMWAIRLEDGTFYKMRHGNLPQLWQYKYRATQHAARFNKGCRVVPVELVAKPNTLEVD